MSILLNSYLMGDVTIISGLPLYSFNSPVTQMLFSLYIASGADLNLLLSFVKITIVKTLFGKVAPRLIKVTFSSALVPYTLGANCYLFTVVFCYRVYANFRLTK